MTTLQRSIYRRRSVGVVYFVCSFSLIWTNLRSVCMLVLLQAQRFECRTSLNRVADVSFLGAGEISPEIPLLKLPTAIVTRFLCRQPREYIICYSYPTAYSLKPTACLLKGEGRGNNHHHQMWLTTPASWIKRASCWSISNIGRRIPSNMTGCCPLAWGVQIL